MPADITIETLDPADIELVGPLWKQLMDHVASLPDGLVPVRPSDESWELERAEMLRELAGEAFVLRSLARTGASPATRSSASRAPTPSGTPGTSMPCSRPSAWTRCSAARGWAARSWTRSTPNCNGAASKTWRSAWTPATRSRRASTRAAATARTSTSTTDHPAEGRGPACAGRRKTRGPGAAASRRPLLRARRRDRRGTDAVRHSAEPTVERLDRRDSTSWSRSGRRSCRGTRRSGAGSDARVARLLDAPARAVRGVARR